MCDRPTQAYCGPPNDMAALAILKPWAHPLLQIGFLLRNSDHPEIWEHLERSKESGRVAVTAGGQTFLAAVGSRR